MPSIKRALNYLLHDRAQFLDSLISNLGFLFPDKLYLSLRFRCKMGYWINWKNPRTFSEKLQWLKIHDRNPEYMTLVDKYAVKDYVARRIGKEYVIPTLGVWEKTEEIAWDTLPEKFVLKTTHAGGGGGVVICRDRAKFDKNAAMRKLKRSLKSDIYSEFREWPYKHVPRRIIAEELLEEDDLMCTKDLPDYKFFCFGGEAKYFKIDFNRFVEHHANYYSMDRRLLPLEEVALPALPNAPIKFPENLDEMKALAEKLSVGHKFLRVDLYNVNGKIFFGELTFYPASGMMPLNPKGWDEIIGDYLKLPLDKRNETV